MARLPLGVRLRVFVQGAGALDILVCKSTPTERAALVTMHITRW